MWTSGVPQVGHSGVGGESVIDYSARSARRQNTGPLQAGPANEGSA